MAQSDLVTNLKYPPSSSQFDDLYNIYSLSSMVRQNIILECNPGNWNIDFQTSNTPVSFLWATKTHPSYVANVFTPDVIENVNNIRIKNEYANIPEFSNDRIECDISYDEAMLLIQNSEPVPLAILSHKICAIMSGILEDTAGYYSCPTQMGCHLWVMLKENEKLPRFSTKYPQGSLSLLNYVRIQFLSIIQNETMCPSSHQIALSSCLTQFGFKYEINPLNSSKDEKKDWIKMDVFINNDNESKMSCQFDTLGRMTSLDMSLSADCYSE